jgi:hypothetical protein
MSGKTPSLQKIYQCFIDQKVSFCMPKVYGGLELNLHLICNLNTVWRGVKWSVSCLNCSTLGKEASILNERGGWVGPMVDPDATKNIILIP